MEKEQIITKIVQGLVSSDPEQLQDAVTSILDYAKSAALETVKTQSREQARQEKLDKPKKRKRMDYYKSYLEGNKPAYLSDWEYEKRQREARFRLDQERLGNHVTSDRTCFECNSWGSEMVYEKTHRMYICSNLSCDKVDWVKPD